MRLGRSLRLGCCLLVLAGGWSGAAVGQATLWPEEEQRFRVGLTLFPACLGAVESLSATDDADAPLRVLIVHPAGEALLADQAAATLRALDRIRGRRLAVAPIAATALDQAPAQTPDAIFIAGIGLGPRRLRGWSERYHVLVFSPFSGDVEAGAVAGIHVADRIRPYVNLAQAARAGVRFKAFFLQVAHQYDE